MEAEDAEDEDDEIVETPMRRIWVGEDDDGDDEILLKLRRTFF